MLAPLYFLEDAVALAVVFKTPEGLFYGFFVSYFYKYHANHHLWVCKLYISRSVLRASARGPHQLPAAEQVVVQVVHRLARALAVIGHQPEGAFDF